PTLVDVAFGLIRRHSFLTRGQTASLLGVDDSRAGRLLHFLRSLVRHNVEAVLGSIAPDAVSLWTSDQEERGNAIDSIAVRIISLKTFTNKYICKTLELTTVDLLRKVGRPKPKPRPKEVLSDE